MSVVTNNKHLELCQGRVMQCGMERVDPLHKCNIKRLSKAHTECANKVVEWSPAVPHWGYISRNSLVYTCATWSASVPVCKASEDIR